MYRKYIWIGLGLWGLVGCSTPVRPEVDGLLCASASRHVDLLPPGATGSVMPAPGATDSPSGSSEESEPHVDNLRQTAAQQGKVVPKLSDRLAVPQALPGANVPAIKLPDRNTTTKADFDEAVRKYFPPLPSIGSDPPIMPGPDGHPLSLADMQKLARSNSPLLRQAAADVAAAKGAAVQAGAYPNPTVGVESATPSLTGGPTYGVFVGQTIKTMGKLKLAQAAAVMDLENAQLAYQRAETDLTASVRSGYFAVLVAQEAMAANRALVKLTDEVYKVNVDQVGGGEAAPYEPMQVAVFAAQARQGLIQARNSYTLAWKNLAATLGIRGMPPTQLQGRLDILVPHYEYDQVLAHVLTKHTDVATAVITEQKARYNLRLAEVTAVPDVSVQTTVINDNSLGVSNRLVAGVQASVPVPVWDRNLGAIRQARGALMRAVEEQHRVRDQLTARVADAFRRYDENRDLLELYRVDILPKQVQAFRAAVIRHYGGEIGRVAYTDLIASEQNLVSVIGPYLAVLGAQWQAVVDVANLLQTEDLFQTEGNCPVAPVPNLEQLLQLPCCHPCSSLPSSTVPHADQTWPKAGFMPTPQPTTLPPVPPAQQLTPTPTGAASRVAPVGTGREVENIDAVTVILAVPRPGLAQVSPADTLRK